MGIRAKRLAGVNPFGTEVDDEDENTVVETEILDKSLNVEAKSTAPQVRAELKRRGLPYDVRKLGGSWVVVGGDSSQWYSSSLMTYDLDSWTAEKWVDVIEEMARNKGKSLEFSAKRLNRDGVETGHKFGCLMLKLPDPVRKTITDWTIENVPDFHLGPGGRELSPHVTVAYGFNPNFDQLDALRGLLVRNGPMSVALTGLSAFAARYGKWTNEDGDVLKADVESDALHQLREQIVGSFELPGNKYPNYVPHVSFAYIDPAVVGSYADLKPEFLPLTVEVSEVVWSGADGAREVIPLSFLPRFGVKEYKEGTDSAGRHYCTNDGVRVDCRSTQETPANAAVEPANPIRGASEAPESPRSLTARALSAAGSILKAGVQVPAEALAKAKKVGTWVMDKVERRYGKKTKRAVAAAVLLSLPMPVPGMSVVLAAPVIAYAELYRQLWRHEKADVKGEFEGIEKYDYPDEAEARAKQGSGKSLASWFTKRREAQGKPCEQGQTTASGCIAADGHGGGKAPADEPKQTQKKDEVVEVPSTKKFQEVAKAIVKGKLSPTTERAYTGKREGKPISGHLAGAIGEEILIQYLKDLGYDDAGYTSSFIGSARNNIAFDLIHDHQLVEAKTGQTSNTSGVWALKYDGRYTKEQEKRFARMSPEKAAALKKRINAAKVAAIHERKERFAAEVQKQLGYKIKAGMMTVIINPDTQTADIYQFDGLHDSISWGSEMAKNAYVKSVKYG